METTPTMKTTGVTRPNRAGFTIIELLIAVIIIGILVAIIVPVLSNRANEARVAATRQDLEALKTAQEHAAIDTGYFYRLYVLDDVRHGDAVSPEAANDVVDGVRDEALRTATQNSRQIFIDTQSGQLLDPNTASEKYDLLTSNETNFNWNGPYVNVARKTKYDDDSAVRDPVGFPLDPYGSKYLLFTKAGVVLEPDGRILDSVDIQGSLYNGRVFDRPTILSLGPNSAPGDGSGPGNPEGQFGRGDDLFRQF